ncbi:type B 50S ribosomal protein L31 [Candidatus Peregrinibacteria bacterium]|nr:type B 50S ribosomal protein L31 [Candidatus Peregrinibacteria bacterium]
MKTGIHPKMYDVVFLDTSSGAQFITQSTIKTDETVKIDGKEYYVIKVEISSDTHPFYTGKHKLIDTAGRVDKFRAKMAKAQEVQKASEKNVKKVDAEEAEEVAKETAKTEE